MAQQREDTAEQYKNAGRVDLSEIELSEAKILKEFLPAIPSKEDIEVTKRLKAAGELLGVELLDHIIVGNYYYSFREEQMF